jgi:protein SCO1
MASTCAAPPSAVHSNWSTRPGRPFVGAILPASTGSCTSAFSPDLIGLTGTTAQIEAAKAAFKVFASKGAVQPGGGYLMNHTNLTYLFDPAGKPLGTLPTDKGPEAVAEELARWVR